MENEDILDSYDLHKYYFKLKRLFEQYNYFESQDDIDNFSKYYLKILNHLCIKSRN